MQKTILPIDDINRITWHSRRGMLELDLILMPFVEKHYRQLSKQDQSCYVQLLACEDQDMFGWFLQHKTPEDPLIDYIVKLVLAKHHQH